MCSTIVRLISLIILLIVGFVAIGYFLGVQPVALERQNGQKIAFVGADRHLYLMDTDGTDVTQLTDYFLETISWSPDGREIAFSDLPFDISVLDIETQQIIRLTDNTSKDINPAWSPDGSRIAFASDRDGNWEIYVMDIDGANPIRLTWSEAEDGFRGLTWSPDSRGIAFVRDAGTVFDETTGFYEYQQIYLVDVERAMTDHDESSLVNLTQDINDCPAGEVYYNPRWSVATDRLAFSMTCGGDAMDIFIMDMSLSQEQANLHRVNLTEDSIGHEAGYQGMSWSPGGDEIALTAFLDDDSRSSEILILNVQETITTGELVTTQITDFPEGAFIQDVAWQPGK